MESDDAPMPRRDPHGRSKPRNDQISAIDFEINGGDQLPLDEKPRPNPNTLFWLTHMGLMGQPGLTWSTRLTQGLGLGSTDSGNGGRQWWWVTMGGNSQRWWVATSSGAQASLLANTLHLLCFQPNNPYSATESAFLMEYGKHGEEIWNIIQKNIRLQ
ncbi:hypothetical protein IEQ34_001918 [Dendrobium chrysotoxum]|uniref:Uncharacterized protein n=1 Tax=Dendrobium chrysotoxum TaxID=161865 RepID=A0AAV7HID8_DENCH|nr:hypothetical protein IEQ34_001918 [Dendrobium chrysotoxum]